MGYDRYRDSNGVTWTIAPPIGNGWQLLAFVADDADPKYDPPAPDQVASMPEPSPMGTVPHPTSEQERVIFLQLKDAIEAYAAAHRTGMILTVTASKSIPWWVWALLGYAVLKSRR